MGNTSVTMGWFLDGKIVRKASVLTHAFAARDFSKIRFSKKTQVAYVASVVPSRNAALRACLKKAFGCPVRFVGKDVPVPVTNRARYPKQVGVDRLINALEAFARFGKPCIAIDFGTAITFDVVSKKGEYLGGVISPGIELTLNALFEKTALLPRIRLKHPVHALGRDTESCIRSGCSFGLGALCDGLIERLCREAKTRYKIIATGGYARYMARYTKNIHRIDEDLSLMGIHRIFLSQKTPKQGV